MLSHMQAVETLCKQVYFEVISGQLLKVVPLATDLHDPLFQIQF